VSATSSGCKGQWAKWQSGTYLAMWGTTTRLGSPSRGEEVGSGSGSVTSAVAL
jgi:hypothetical protein